MKKLNLFKKIIKEALLILSLVLSACYQVDTPEQHKTDTQAIVVLESCDDILDECDYGCILDDNGPRCATPCETDVCDDIPYPRCESTVFLLEFNRNTCVGTDDEIGFKCVENINTRRYCGCVPEDGEVLAHCFDDSCENKLCASDEPICKDGILINWEDSIGRCEYLNADFRCAYQNDNTADCECAFVEGTKPC